MDHLKKDNSEGEIQKITVPKRGTLRKKTTIVKSNNLDKGNSESKNLKKGTSGKDHLNTVKI